MGKHRRRLQIPIRVVLIAGSLLICGLPIIGMWTWSYREVLRHEVSEVSGRHLLIARHLSGSLAGYHDNIIAAFGAFAPAVARGQSLDHLDRLFTNLHFRHVCAFTAAGELVHAYTARGAQCPKQLDTARLGEFAALADQTHGRAVSPVRIAEDRVPVLAFADRIDDLLVVGAVRTSYFAEVAKAVQFGELGPAVVVDQTGRVLVHSRADWASKAADLSALEPVRRMMQGQSGVAEFHSPALDRRMIAGFDVVEGAGWGVMVPQPFAELERDAAHIASTARNVLIIALLSAAALAAIFSGWVTRPINAVSAVARRMSGADPATRVEERWLAHPVAEIAQLGAAYNDMADRVAAAQAEEVAQREKAESAVAAKNRFLAVLSHEIRTPLNGLLGMAALLRSSGLDKQQREYADRLNEAGAGLIRVVSDVLDHSKIEAGHIDISNERFDLLDLVRSVCDMVAIDAEKNGNKIRIECPEGIDTRICNDPARARQVLVNLAFNAAKFTHDGAIDVRIAEEPGASRGLRVTVEDTGIGIPPDEHGRIFDDFTRVNPIKGQGAGLGLAISRRLVHAMGGRIGFTSEPGKGSAFWFTLPDLPAGTPGD